MKVDAWPWLKNLVSIVGITTLIGALVWAYHVKDLHELDQAENKRLLAKLDDASARLEAALNEGMLLRKELRDRDEKDPFAEKLKACEANADVLHVAKAIELSIRDDESKIYRVTNVGEMNGKPIMGLDHVMDQIRARRIELNRADLSALRQRLVCVK
jgi:hypothetical protein